MILRALLRALLQSPGRCLAAVCLVAVAVTVHGGTFIGLEQLQSTTDRIYQELRLFDLELRIKPTPEDLLPDEDTIRAEVRGISAATWRLLVTGTAELPGDRLVGAMILAVAPESRPQVGDWRLLRGASPSLGHPEQVLVDSTFAADMNIAPGDVIVLRVQGRELRVTVSGIGVFPEFLMTSVNESFQIPVRRTAVAVLMSEELISLNADFSTFDLLNGPQSVFNSLAVRIEPGFPREAVREALRSFLAGADVSTISATWSEDQHSVRCNQGRISLFRNFLPTVIAVFTGLTFIVLLLLVLRMTRAFQRETALLMALGAARRSVLLWWIAVIAMVVAAGAALGTVGALLLSSEMTQEYMDSTGFPLLLSGRNPLPLLHAWALCLALVPPAVIAPVLPLLFRSPSKLLEATGAPTITRALTWIHRLDRLIGRIARIGYPERLGMRNIVRRPLAFTTSTLCISGMLVVAASMYVFAEGIERGLAEYLSGHRWNYLVEFVDPVPEAELRDLLIDAGATSLEPLRIIGGTLRYKGSERSYRLVAGIVPSTLHEEKGLVYGRFLERDESPEIVVDLRTALRMGLRVDDDVDVASDGPNVRLRVVGVTSNYTANQAFVSPRTLARIAGHSVRPSGALITGPPALALRLGRMPEVARLMPGDLLAKAGIQNFAAVSAFLRIYGNLGLLAGTVLILVFVRISVDDRAAEYALLRSQGFSTLELLRSLFVEVFVIGIFAVLISFPVTRFTTLLFQARFMALADWCPLNTSFSSWLRLMGPAFLLMLLSVLPALHRATHIRAADALRMRLGG